MWSKSRTISTVACAGVHFAIGLSVSLAEVVGCVSGCRVESILLMLLNHTR